MALGVAPFLDNSENEKRGADLFIEAMNKKANDLGLKETYFFNDTGLDLSPETSGGYGSAKNTAMMINNLYIKHPEALELTNSERKNFSSLEKRRRRPDSVFS